MRKRIMLVLMAILSTFLSGCGETTNTSDTVQDELESENITLNIAYQYGLAYAPLIVCQQNKYIEEIYREKTGLDIEVIWTQMSSGADINTAFASGELDAAFVGVAPAITGVSKGVGYKIFTNLSGQEHGLMTKDSEIKSLADLVNSDKQIALVNTGSIQHIILAKALSDNGYEAHALDANLVAMKHPDGMASILSGSISCHLTTNPYLYQERAEEFLYELPEISESWLSDNSFVVGIASQSLYSENNDLYMVLCEAISQAIDYVNEKPEETAKLTCSFNGNSEDVELEYLLKGVYSTETKGVFELAEFMYEASFITSGFDSYNDIVFDNVKGD